MTTTEPCEEGVPVLSGLKHLGMILILKCGGEYMGSCPNFS